MTKFRFSGLILIFSAAFVFLQYRLWFESDGILEMLQLKKKLAVQSIKTEEAKKRNEALVFQVERLQHSKDAVESRARNELGMIKKGEIFYQIVK